MSSRFSPLVLLAAALVVADLRGLLVAGARVRLQGKKLTATGRSATTAAASCTDAVCKCESYRNGAEPGDAVFCSKMEMGEVVCMPPNPNDGMCPADHTKCEVLAANATDYQLPATHPDPLMLLMGMFQALDAEAESFGPTIKSHIASLIMTGLWNCVATYHGTWNDGLASGRPAVDIIPGSLANITLHSSDARMLCFLQGLPTLFTLLLPTGLPALLEYLSSASIQASTTHSFDADVENCAAQMDESEETAKECFKTLAACYGYRPDVVGTIVMTYVQRYAATDGWNTNGTLSANGAVCTANCERYSDTTAYYPNYLSAGSSWRPIREHDGLGYFFRQEHETPHIGPNARGRVLTRQEIDAKTAPYPCYNYGSEKNLLLTRVSQLNDTKKMLAEFTDNKRSIASMVLGSIIGKFPQQMKIEDVALFFTGYLAAEHDAFVVAWKEKRHFDLARPTTVVKDMGPHLITTYAGPGQGVQTFKARDFQSYLRAVAQSEYPSASACVCTAVYEFAEAWQSLFLQSNTSLQFQLTFPAGSSTVEPGITPQQDLQVHLPDFGALRDACTEARLDAGVAFTKSADAGKVLCQGIGAKALDYVTSKVGATAISPIA